MTTENGARVAGQSGAFHLANLGPARGAVGGDMALLPGAPERAADRGGAAAEAAGAGERARLVEDVRRVGVVAIPPREDRPGMLDRWIEQRERSEARRGGKERVSTRRSRWAPHT